MESLILGIVLVFLLVAFLIGYHMGFMRLIVSLCLTILSFTIAMVLVKPLETYITENTGLYEKISKNVEKQIDKNVSDSIDENSINVKDLEEQYIKDLNVPNVIKDSLIKGNTDENREKLGVYTFSGYLSDYLTRIIIRVIAYLILFIAFRIACVLVVEIANVIALLPVIKEVNKFVGGVVGVIYGIFILWCICLILTSIAGTKDGSEILRVISSNTFLNFIYSNNLILKILI